MIEKYPDIKILAKIPANFNRAKGQEVTENILQRFKPGEIDAIYYMADEMTFGGLQAIKAAGRLGEFKIISVDGQKEAMDLLRAREIDYEAIFHPDDQAVAVRILCDIVNGRTPDWQTRPTRVARWTLSNSRACPGCGRRSMQSTNPMRICQRTRAGSAYSLLPPGANLFRAGASPPLPSWCGRIGNPEAAFDNSTFGCVGHNA